MLDILVVADQRIAESFDQLLTRAAFFAVHAIELILYLAFEGHENFQLHPGAQADGIQRLDIERIGHHKRKDVLFDVYRDCVKGTKKPIRERCSLNWYRGIFARK